MTDGFSLVDQIGNTPLLRLAGIGRELKSVALFAKAEWFNPGGSVKDRAAWSMVRRARQDGRFREGQVLLDATSGNTGIAYAMLGAALGFRVKICLPENASPERKRILAAYGADLALTSPLEGSDGAIREARRLFAQDPERYFYCDQYSNADNWRAHYEGTAEEIWRQTEGRITHWIGTLGTSGTFVGTTLRLRELNPAIRCIEVEPDAPFHGLEGMKHMASSIQPGIYDPGLADDKVTVGTEQAYEMVMRLAREEGLLTGVSSGAAAAAALQVARRLDSGVVVTLFPDSADRYLSERFWEEVRGC